MRAAVLVLSVTLFGCSNDARSCDLDTDQMLMWATVSDLDDGVEVEVEFEAVGLEGASLSLCPDRDQLEINGVVATEVRALGYVYYLAEFSEPAESFEIVLDRVDATSVNVVVEMPPSLAITSPTANSSHSRSAGLDVGWSPAWADHVLQLAVEDSIGSECLDQLGVVQQIDDTGTYTLGGSSLLSGPTGGSCEVTLELTRDVMVDYPDELHDGGEIAGFVRRRLPFTSTE
jgi:hypothetical protein